MQSRKTWKRLFLGLAVLVLLISGGPWLAGAHLNPSSYRGDPRAPGDDLKLTDEDRVEIVSQTLKREIEHIKEERSKYEGGRKGNLTLTLSTQNLKPLLVPDIPEVKFILIEPAEIEKRIKEARGISYLAFDKFEVKGQLVKVSLSNVFRGAGRIRTFISIQTNEYEYRKEDGKWIGKFVKSGHLIT